jgi:hypothetical protein
MQVRLTFSSSPPPQRGHAATKQVYDKRKFPTDRNNATDEKAKASDKIILDKIIQDSEHSGCGPIILTSIILTSIHLLCCYQLGCLPCQCSKQARVSIRWGIFLRL